MKKRIHNAEKKIHNISKNGSGPLKPRDLMKIKNDLISLNTNVEALFDFHLDLESRLEELEEQNDNQSRDPADRRSSEPNVR